MGWEARRKNCRYYVRRRGGRRTYLGRGPVADLAAALDAAARRVELAHRAAVKADAARFRAATAAAVRLEGYVDRLVRGSLYAAGYHLHHRSWRRRRPLMPNQLRDQTPSVNAAAVPAPPRPVPAGTAGTAGIRATADPVAALLDRARRGDLAVLPELRAYLTRNPGLWRDGADLSRVAEEGVIALIAGTDQLTAESVRFRVADLKRRLAGPAASPLEVLVVDRIGVAYLHVHAADAELFAARRAEERAEARGEVPRGTPRSVFCQRRLDSAQRRYLAAVKALALLRRLLGPGAPGPAGAGGAEDAAAVTPA